MSSPQISGVLSSSPSRSIRLDTDPSRVHRSSSGHADDSSHAQTPHPRHSPTLIRTYDPTHPDVQERQRTMDVDSAMSMQLSRVRSASVAIPTRPPYVGQHSNISPPISPRRSPVEDFSALPSHEAEQINLSRAAFADSTATSLQHMSPGHDPSLFASLDAADHDDAGLGGLPMYQPNMYRSNFDFGVMESFAAEEKGKLGLVSPTETPAALVGLRPLRPERSQSKVDSTPPQDLIPGSTGDTTPDSSSTRMRQRKLSLSNSSRPRRQRGKMALFEGDAGAPPPSLGQPTSGRLSAMPSFEHGGRDVAPARLPPPIYTHTGYDRPYRFSFYSNALSATIHARSLSELPADGQSFEELFCGGGIHSDQTDEMQSAASRPRSSALPGGDAANGFGGRRANGVNGGRIFDQTQGPSNATTQDPDGEPYTWWLDIMSPTDEEMKLLSKVFSIHPLTTEDIQMEETREKIELFRNYYLVCFRSFDQDPYSPTYLEPLNMYIVVFREGTLSFHFRGTPHPQNVRRRIKQLKDYINVTSDWISYALIDDITDAFGPLIQSIEYEVDSIDELVLILKEAEQSDMLRRIGTCRKKVMGLLRLMGSKADVVKGLAKRCNENWTVAPKSDIGLYLSDIQDHLITMTQNLNHYEKILSRSHSNYLAQISIEMTDANNQINDVLSKLTALGTVLIPMNLVTGLWGMNVHVPGQDNTTTFTWFVSIVGGLVAFGICGGYLTYRLMLTRR